MVSCYNCNKIDVCIYKKQIGEILDNPTFNNGDEGENTPQKVSDIGIALANACRSYHK